MNESVVVLRVRKGVPGIGRKLSSYYDANEVTCGFRPKLQVPNGAFVLNYGRSQWPIWFMEARERGVSFINNPDAVARSVDKVETLRLLSTAGVPCLEATTDRDIAQDWLDDGQGLGVLVRHTVTGKQGKGIEYIDLQSADGMPFAPLYTKHYDKDVEFRVHVVNGRVVDYVQKKKMGSEKLGERGLSEPDMLLRNHKRGWVFARKNIYHSRMVEQLALDTVAVLGLDYAGIDILAKVNADGVYDAVVCESNSAPGMSSPTTFKAYTNAFDKIMTGAEVLCTA